MRTEQQSSNIIKLASFLENLPVDYPHFDMEDWFHPADHLPFYDEETQIRASKELKNPRMGSCGCALGHSVAAGIEVKATSWKQYAELAFGITGRDFENVFSGELSFESNTPKAAARRLRALIPICGR